MNIWVYTGEVNAKRIRERYLQSILRQDIAFFDNVGAGEVATRIQTDTRESGFLFISQAVTIYLSILQILFS
jgi:ABC-type multidrug transport system fused ATPase/permease subunit